MFRALVLKELRETAWIALVGLAVHLAFVANHCGYAILPFYDARRDPEVIPFHNDSFLVPFVFVSIALAAALGLRQTVFESRGGTWLFLLHRPASMRRVLASKLAVGGGLYLVCGLIPILSYAVWAALPGHHASPFFWWLTASAWFAWAVIAVAYLVAFLSGIRPVRWFGTRLLPLAAGGLIVGLPAIASNFSPLAGVVAFLLVPVWLFGLILFAARSRDFS